MQIWIDHARPGAQVDRLLNGPTHDAWITPWRTYLEGMGVRFEFGARATRLNLQDGRFDCQRQLALIEAVLLKGKADGFPRTRVMGSTEWAMTDLPGVDGFIEYEARLNDLLEDHEDPVCCLYDVTKFSASLIMDALRVHPAVIIGGVLQENPFYMPPDQFLRERRERRPSGVAIPC